MIRVLIADDHAAIRAGVRALLGARHGIEVHEAADGAQAIDKALELTPDLIILDLTMPVMGGYAVARALRDMAPQIPILFFSIHDSAVVVSEAKQLGGRGFVAKSEAGRVLLEAVDAIVTRNSTFFPRTTEMAVVTL